MLVISFSIDAECECVYGQREALINAVIGALFEAKRTSEKAPENFPNLDSYLAHLRSASAPSSAPSLRIRARPTHGSFALLFRQDKAGEDEQIAEGYIEHGLADLRVLFQPLAAGRTFVTVECLDDNMLPAMTALLQEFARRYRETELDIQRWLSEHGAFPEAKAEEIEDRPKAGAPRMEERPDWPERCQKARKYLELMETGRYTAQGAAAKVGLSYDTIRTILKRMEKLGLL